MGAWLACGLLLWASCAGEGGEAPATLDPRLAFTPFRFDASNRGSFNISSCMLDFLRCMEIVRPDYICYYTDSSVRHYSYSVCPYMREFCHDFYGEYDNYAFKFTLFEGECREDDHYS